MSGTIIDAKLIRKARRLIDAADVLFISAGAGMGVDSGLPDFRGNEGFWKAYPKFRSLGLSFVDLANPRWFYDDPQQAWGFYGHRFNLYRKTAPHVGFEILKQWSSLKTHASFVFTSNVDGHFQRAGFSEQQVIECHGSINHLQCLEQCSNDIWPAEFDCIDVDETVLRATGELPHCPHCGALARPNILMFGDFGWNPQRTDAQQRRYSQWLQALRSHRLVILEFGAGTAVPTVRYESESLLRHNTGGTQLIRTNPRDFSVPAGQLSLPYAALEALNALSLA